MKLTADYSGSYWISSNQNVYVYAVRFVPSEIIPLERSWRKPHKIELLPNGNLFVDFGKAAFGQIELKLMSDVSDDTKDTVIVHLGECIKNGAVDRMPGGSRRYECLKIPLYNGLHTYKPIIPKRAYGTGLSSIYMPMEIGEVMPFRYCEIENYSPLLSKEDISQIAVNYRFNDDASYFHCDNERLNQVWEMCKYSMKATSFIGYYVDGDRERCPYEADALINQLGHYACDSEYSLGQRTIEWFIRNPTWPTEWIMQTLLMAWYDYLFSGDETIINKYKNLLHNHTLMGFVHPKTRLVSTTAIKQTKELLLSVNLGSALSDIVDWPHGTEKTEFAPQGGEDDGFVYTDYNAVVNAYHYEACKLMAKIYESIGETQNQLELEDYCRNFYTLFNKSFLDEDKGIYLDGIGTDHSSLHANMFALCFGLVPDKYLQSVSDFIISKGMACSVYGAQFLLEALYKSGNSEYALQLMSSSNQRSWINMINEGSTISTEAWSNTIKPNQDWNHAWGAAPANIIPFWLVGFRPLSPGFKHAILRPQIASLNKIDCKLPTLWGGVTINIRRETDEFSMSIEIPSEILCDIYLPIPDDSKYTVTLDGKTINDYSIRKNYIKLNNPLTGIHYVKILKQANRIEQLLMNKESKESIYNLHGYKMNNHNSSGIRIKSRRKFLLK